MSVDVAIDPVPVDEVVPTVPASTRWSVPLTSAGLVISLGTALADQHLVPGLWGLPRAIYPTWYVGLALIVAGIALARRTDGLHVGYGVLALVLVLTATPAIVYDVARYSWTAKHLGVVNYIRIHGQVHSSIDIYNAWPGFFAAIAWLCRAGAIHDPLVIARWWPPVVDLMVAAASACMASRLLANRYRAWLAAGLFFLANAIGQDYFSPQSVALLLAMSIYAVTVPLASAEGSVAERFRVPLWRSGLILLLGVALATTHQITPYLVGASLVVLVVFGFVRPWWVPLLPIVPAAVWTLVNLSTVRRYFSPSTIGNVTGNVSGPGSLIAGAHKDLVLQLSSDALGIGAFVVGLLALAFVVRNHRKLDVALAACAASAGTLTLVTNYGNEGILRVTVFALPWLSVLALGGGAKAILKRRVSIAAVLVLLVTTFILADTLLDGWNAMLPADIRAERYYESHAPDHAIIVALGSASPAKLTENYPNLRFKTNLLNDRGSMTALLAYLTRNPAHLPAVYFYMSDSGKYYGQLEGLWTPAYYDLVVNTLRHSPHFTTVIDTPTTHLFLLKPNSAATGAAAVTGAAAGTLPAGTATIRAHGVPTAGSTPTGTAP